MRLSHRAAARTFCEWPSSGGPVGAGRNRMQTLGSGSTDLVRRDCKHRPASRDPYVQTPVTGSRHADPSTWICGCWCWATAFAPPAPGGPRRHGWRRTHRGPFPPPRAADRSAAGERVAKLVSGLGLGPGTSRGSPVGRPAGRFHMQGTCGFLTGLRPVPGANGPQREGPSDTKRRDLTAPAGG